MTTLVTDLLELARLDEAKPLELAPVNLIGLAPRSSHGRSGKRSGTNGDPLARW